MENLKTPPRRGRTRAFNEGEFLDTVIALFRSSGYAGVSVSDITAKTGLTVGSIYKAYKDKEGVFAKALDRYILLRNQRTESLLVGMPTARAKVAKLLESYVTLSEGAEGALGCMVVSGIVNLDLVGGAATTLRQQLHSRRQRLAELIVEGQKDGSIALSVASDAAVDVLLAMLQGVRVVGRAGSLTNDPQAFVACALKILD